MSKNRSRVIFITCTCIAGTILFQMGMYVLYVLLGWDPKFNLIQVCHSVARSLGLSSVEYMLDALVFYTVFLSIWEIGKQLFAANKIDKRLAVYRHEQLTQEINRKYNEGNQDFTVISCSAPIAVTMGFLNPKIILSTGLFNLLDKNELEAVIYHELYHKKHRDPLKIFLLSLFASIMWYIPILKWFHQKYKIIREVLADHYAINRQGTPVDLGSALLKMLKTVNRANMPFSYVSFADTSVNYRIKYILDPQTEIPLKLPFMLTITSIYVFLMLCILFLITLF
ncbi:M56 family metallopeptidase [Saccharococcus caldoxylosilyticus]|jgi:beta-lactamase regulating signal transducer with metallopeptidase domain|uniref:M56 family metallopeptidase n=1 Tax=Saccharococcus caldoxylosilyticus TaxID=81408 RepID=UPI0002DF2200|nr:M56 family metallopeptidase [Parageobacillus caldoxylosilyticus]